MTDPFLDPQEVQAEVRKEEDRLRRRHLGDIRKVLSQPEGRRLIWDLLSETGVFRASFALNASQAAFNEGRRDIGLKLLLDVNSANPDSYTRMAREFASEQSKEK